MSASDQKTWKGRPAVDGPPTAAEERAELEARALEAQQGLMGLIFAAMKMRGRTLRAPDGSLPLTVIGGFLGSGKTTLLNRLLASPHGRRLVVLVNDFGRINIDVALVESSTEDTISLTNGCACCAVASDLTNALIELAERDDPPDAIVLEASGIAEPYGVVQAALGNPSIRLDGSLVLVDAETIRTLAEHPVAGRLYRNQISAADLIVLSKLDLCDEAQRADARSWLAVHYPDKRVVEAVQGDIPTEVVLGIHTERDPQADAPEPTDHAHDFESLSLTAEEPLSRERLLAFLDSLPPSVLRGKGVLHLAEDPSRRTIFQRVGGRWSCTPDGPWGEETPGSSLVVIGPPGDLDGSELAARFEACHPPES